MNKSLERIILYPKDLMNITGKRIQAARRLHAEIKKDCGKPKNGFVTIDDFCRCTGIAKEEVQKFIK